VYMHCHRLRSVTSCRHSREIVALVVEASSNVTVTLSGSAGAVKSMAGALLELFALSAAGAPQADMNTSAKTHKAGMSFFILFSHLAV